MLEMLTRALIFQLSNLIQFHVILSSFNNSAREFERSHLQKFKTQGRGGGSWSFELIGALLGTLLFEINANRF